MSKFFEKCIEILNFELNTYLNGTAPKFGIILTNARQIVLNLCYNNFVFAQGKQLSNNDKFEQQPNI